MEELTENEKDVLAEIERKFDTDWFSSYNLSMTVFNAGIHCVSLNRKGYLECKLHETIYCNMYRIKQER